MIGQHLLMRCTRGCFDQNMAAGFKAAAISPVLRKLPGDSLRELNAAIIRRGSLPDVVMRNNTDPNRGILHISQYMDATLIIRSFSVKDLCDSRGDVTYVQTYILTEKERLQFINHPEIVLNMDNYDVYHNISRRSGGLGSGNRIETDENLSLFHNCFSPISLAVFEKCGFDKRTFAALISALCDRVSGHGNVELRVWGITSGDWERYGGSPLGEQLLVALLSILPSCITRFMSGVSFWNEDCNYSGIDDCKLRIVTERNIDSMERDEVSQVDLVNNRFTNISSYTKFGEFLWDIRNNVGELKKFHDYISELFGENVDCVSKMSSVMDVVTELYLRQKGEEFADNDFLPKCFHLFSQVMQWFPNIDKECCNLLCQKAEVVSCYSVSFENAMLLLLENPSANQLQCYHQILYCILQNITEGCAQKESIDRVSLLVKQNDFVITEQLLYLLQNFDSHEKPSCSDDMVSLLMVLVNESGVNLKLRSLADRQLFRCLKGYLKNQQWKKCADIICIWSKRLAEGGFSANNEKGLYHSILYIIERGDSDTRRIMIQILKNEFARKLSISEELKEFWNICFCNTDGSLRMNIVLDSEMFSIFVKLMPYLDNKSREQWENQYLSLLYETGSNTEYLYPDENYDDYIEIKKEIGYFVLEKVRYKYSPYQKNWKAVEKILNISPRRSKESLCGIIDYFIRQIDDSVQYNQFLHNMADSRYFYSYYVNKLRLAAIEDKSDLIVKLEEKLLEDDNCLQELVKFVEKEGDKNLDQEMPELYYRLWVKKNQIVLEEIVSLPKFELFTQNVKNLELNLHGSKYINEIMKYFEQIYRTCMGIQSISGNMFVAHKDTIVFLKQAKQRYGWRLPYNEQIDICYQIDQISIIDQVYELFETFGNLRHGEQILYRNRVKSKIMEESDSKIRVAVIILLSFIQDSDYCETIVEYYNDLEQNKVLNYLMDGLEFVNKLDGNNYLAIKNRYEYDFVQKMISYVLHDSWHGALLDHKFVDRYRKAMNYQVLSYKAQEEIYEKALSVGDKEIKKVFALKKENKAPDLKKFVLFTSISYLVILLISFIEISTVGLVFMVNPIAGVIVAVTWLIILIAVMVIINLKFLKK